VASEDHVLAVNQDRSGEAEDPDAVGDLPDLFARMSARVAPIGLQVVGRIRLRLCSRGFCGSSLNATIGLADGYG
jgi:hypothetical protein